MFHVFYMQLKTGNFLKITHIGFCMPIICKIPSLGISTYKKNPNYCRFFSVQLSYVPPKPGCNLPNQATLLIITSSGNLCICYKLVLSSFQKHTRASCTQRMEGGSQRRKNTSVSFSSSLLLMLPCLWYSFHPWITKLPYSHDYWEKEYNLGALFVYLKNRNIKTVT